MKNPINNNLDQLFNKAKADKQNLDDFEKDALAGFDMLGSEQEAKELKAALDTRIQKELFAKEEKNNQKIYWLAAAGLALVIGLSVLFVLNNNDSLSKSGKLAITTDAEAKQETLPESVTEIKEQAPPPPPVETAVAANEKSPAKEDLATEKADKKEELKDLEQKTQHTEGKKELVTNGISSRSILSPATINAGPKDVTDSEKESDDRKKDNYKGGDINDKNSNLDDLAKNTGSKGKETEVFKAQPSAKQDQSVNFEQTETNSKDVADNKSVKEKSKSNTKNKDEDAKVRMEESVAANSGGYSERKKEERKSNKRAKKSAETQSTAGLATPAYYDETPGSGSAKTTTKAVSGETNNSPAEDNRNNNATTVNCFYPGGETILAKDLKEKLAAENLDQKFDATLFVDEHKVVKKVEFTNAFDLTKKQKEDVTKILKNLDKFNFSNVQVKKGEYPYKISYRP